MDKQTFLALLREQLRGLPQSDIEQSLEYYGEMIDDRMEDGVSEEEAVAAMETPEEIARQILLDMPLPKVVKAKARPTRPLAIWEIVLIIVGSPVWVPLIFAFVITFFALYMVIWAVIVALYAVNLAFALCGVAAWVQSGIALFTGAGLQVPFYIGLGLASLGIAVLLFFAFNVLSIKLVALNRRFILWAKKRFVRG